jgi:hypothetical protein
MTYAQQAEAALRLPKGHPARFLALYGNPQPFKDVHVVEAASVSEARRLLWAFKHPFGVDLLGCAETNS